MYAIRYKEVRHKKALATGVTKALKKRRQRRLLRDDESRALRGTRKLPERRVVRDRVRTGLGGCPGD